MTSEWLVAFLQDAEEEARRRGDSGLAAEHLALAFTRAAGPPSELLAAASVDGRDWRDHVVMVLARNQGVRSAREGRPTWVLASSLAELRFAGTMTVDATVDHIVGLAQEEAVANGDEVGPAHLLVALLLEGQSVAAGTGSWLGMTPGRVRSLAGLRNERRVVAGGAPPGGAARRAGTGPMVLCGGGADADLMGKVMERAPRRAGRAVPRAVLVDLGWQTRRPTADERRRHVEELTSLGLPCVDSELTDRVDAAESEVCERLASADVVWFGGGDSAAIYDRLWATPALEAIRDAHEGGAVVGGVSAGARVWGKGTLSDFASLGDPEPFALLGWLGDLVVVNHYGPGREPELRRTLAAFPGCRAVAIAHGGAVLVTDGISMLHPGVTGTPHVLLAGADQTLVPLGG